MAGAERRSAAKLELAALCVDEQGRRNELAGHAVGQLVLLPLRFEGLPGGILGKGLGGGKGRGVRGWCGVQGVMFFPREPGLSFTRT